jgi:cell division protein FtsL
MTNEQPYLAIGVPIVFNAVIAILLNARISDIGTRIDDTSKRIDDLRSEFRELIASERRTWDSSFKHVLDKLGALESRFAK